MPLSPTPAQAEASRHNGALSTGPIIPEGKARSSRNSTRHNLTGAGFHLLPHEDEAAFAALRSCLLTRHAPADPAEQHWVEQIVAAMWRQQRLQTLETRVLATLLAEDTNEPDASRPALPSLATLARYLGRIERDHRLALTELERLQEQRRHQPRGNPAQLRFMAELLERHPGMSEPEPLPAEPLLNRHERRRQAALERAMA